VLQAETELANARADEASLAAQRQQYLHAIAVLIGVPPGDFALPAADWNTTVPDVPVGLPSALLQQRPDIAQAERAVAQANAQIGIARAAYYPSVTLGASVGQSASRAADLFNASSLLWAVGVSLAQTVFDGGAIAADVRNAEASHQAAVADYRQTVLEAFQEVEDLLATRRALNEQLGLRRQASASADEAERQVRNRYQAGQVSYADVITAQATALSARRALVQLQASLQTNAIALIQATGGGWTAERLSDDGAMSTPSAP